MGFATTAGNMALSCALAITGCILLFFIPYKNKSFMDRCLVNKGFIFIFLFGHEG